MLEVVRGELQRRIAAGVTTGKMSDQSAAIGRLFMAVTAARTISIDFEVVGATGGTWSDDDGAAADTGIDFLMRQAACIAGGTTEMARNVISERVLGMPRERAVDRDVAFRDVPRGPTSR